MIKIDGFKIIGIATITTNKNGKAATDLGLLWQRFFKEDIIGKIENKINNDIYAIYTDYESDFTGKYTTIIGLKVKSLDNIPEYLVGREFKGDTFVKYTAKGEMPNAVVKTWKEIWDNDSILNRKYTYDFEVYADKCQRGENSEVDIYIATKP